MNSQHPKGLFSLPKILLFPLEHLPDSPIDVIFPTSRVLSIIWRPADIVWHLAEFVWEVGEFVWLLRTDSVSVGEFVWRLATDFLTVGDIVWLPAAFVWLVGDVVWLFADIVWRVAGFVWPLGFIVWLPGLMRWLFCGLLKTTDNRVSPVAGSTLRKVNVISRFQSTITRARVYSSKKG